MSSSPDGSDIENSTHNHLQRVLGHSVVPFLPRLGEGDISIGALNTRSHTYRFHSTGEIDDGSTRNGLLVGFVITDAPQDLFVL